MKLMGIEFAPWNVPLERRLQMIGICFCYYIVMFGGPTGTLFITYIIFYTHYWAAAILYLIWMCIIDRETCERGGRRGEWLRNIKLLKYARTYFPMRLQKSANFELEPKENYLFCCFPHGIFPNSVISTFTSNWGDFKTLFPDHTPYLLILHILFYFPIMREIYLAGGTCSVSAKSIKYLLKSEGGGKVAALVVGGAAEVFHCKPNVYKIILRKRKGFIKIALQTGTSLVPVYTFGESDAFKIMEFPEGSLISRLQKFIKSSTGIALVIPKGRGIFQYSFGILPHRKPLHTIVGSPITVEKIEHPKQEQIDALHEEFIAQLTDLFEKEKFKYLKNAEQANLVID